LAVIFSVINVTSLRPGPNSSEGVSMWIVYPVLGIYTLIGLCNLST